jgi:hypothetical protein
MFWTVSNLFSLIISTGQLGVALGPVVGGGVPVIGGLVAVGSPGFVVGVQVGVGVFLHSGLSG